MRTERIVVDRDFAIADLTAGCSARSSSISAAASTAASSSPAIRRRTRSGFRQDVLALVQGTGADHHPLSRRQFRQRLQLGGRRRPGRQAARAARSRVALDRNQAVRHQRIHRLVPQAERRADAGVNLGTARPTRRGVSSNTATIPAARRCPTCVARTAGRAARREVLVPRQRDGRAVADQAQDRARIWPRRRRNGQNDAMGRPLDRTRRLRLLGPQHADIRRLGNDGAGALLRSRRISSRCTPISTTMRDEHAAFLAASNCMDVFIKEVVAIADAVAATAAVGEAHHAVASTSGTSGTAPAATGDVRKPGWPRPRR